MILLPEQARKLAGAFRLLDSPVEGEAIAALQAVKRLLPDGLTIGDLVERGRGDLAKGFATLAPEKPQRGLKATGPITPIRCAWWNRQGQECFRSSYQFSDWERSFLTSMMLQDEPPSKKQNDKLTSLLRKARGLAE